MTKKEEAEKRTAEVQALDKSSRHYWWAIGEQAWHVHSKALWKELECKSFQAWLEATVPMSRRSAYDAKDAWGELHGLDGYKDIPRENAKILFRDIPKSKRPRYLKNAKTMPTRKFRAFVEGGKVGAAKAEDTVGKHLIFSLDQWANIEKALDFLLAEHGVPSVEEGIEYMAVEFMQDPARADRAMEMEQDADAAAESEKSEN